ncbi:hypothetical protein O1611_g5312 [Lasiodiplodia mahajangana]|uniref:Uncharacterized protein n=1 Tax=Lasiodiplodia mahajangana TaxID=1108764 RepID=A0ACC2JLP8_9PEZI|nr:hypothetical protein O1611_g5312 [Lasiodiplodia mahajangana]
MQYGVGNPFDPSYSPASTASTDNAPPPAQEPSLSETLEAFKSTGGKESKSSAFKVLTEVVESGSECAVQTLYEGPPKCRCCKNWVTTYPRDLKSSIEQQIETKKKALVVRMGKNHEDGKPLVLDSIVVQSQFLKEFLGEVFHGYRGITTTLDRLVFKSPFHAFYYRWDALEELAENRKNTGSDADAHVQLLYNLLDIELRETRDEIRDLVKNGVITYDTLWAIFRPGSLVYSAIEDRDRVFLLQSTYYVEGFMGLNVKFVDWDGTQFGYRTIPLTIRQFAGTQRVADLGVYPIQFHPSRKEVEEGVKARGEKFRDMHGFQYMLYKGAMLCDRGRRRKIDERIIVDASSYRDQYPMKMHLEPLDTQGLAPTIQVNDDIHHDDRRAGPHPHHPHHSYHPHHPPPPPPPHQWSPGQRLPPPPPDWDKRQNIGKEFNTNLTEEQLLLCNSHVCGYALQSKQWGEFDVTQLRPISWNDAAFPNLMLPEGFKNLILSFIEGHTTGESSFDDIIEGKGLGVIMLLVGKPGIGKTLTAEAVADKVRRPLYVLSAGELGTDASRVEDRLTSVLAMTERWNAVLLFDECDVFLQKRSIDNLDHNEIVAVFLRVIEYFRGILFMTTNRGDAIDTAFQSRIHLTLHYPDLDAEARRSIWERLITRSEPHSTLDDESYSKLSELPLNGRQIRNTVKISLLLASKEKVPLGIEHVWTVLRATGEVDAETLKP